MSLDGYRGYEACRKHPGFWDPGTIGPSPSVLRTAQGPKILPVSTSSELPEMQSNAVRRVIFGVVHANITYPFWYLIKDIGSHCI